MSFLDKLKETAFQVAAAASDVAEKAAVAGKAAADTAVKQTKTAASIGKIKLAIASEEDKLKKAYIELGRLYYRDYEAHSEPEMEEYLPWCDRCAESKQLLTDLNQQLEQLKAEAKKEPEVEEHEETEDTSIFADFVNAEVAEEVASVEETEPVEDLSECVEFEVVDVLAEEPAVEEPTVGTLYVDVTGQE